MREEEREVTKTKNTRERREFLTRNGYSQVGIDPLRKLNVNVVKPLKEKDKEVQKRIQYIKIRKGKYNERYNHIITEIPVVEYLEIGKRWDSETNSNS